MALAKKEKEVEAKEGGESYWPRLLAAPGKAPQNVKVDWDKWVDEDEEGAAGGIGGDFDFGEMGGMGGGGMGGMGGMMGGMGGGGMPGGMDLSQLMAGMGGGGGSMMGAEGGSGFDVGAFPDDGEDEEEGAEEADAPAAAEEVTA